MRVPSLAVFGSLHLVPDPDQLHLLVLDIFRQHLNFILCLIPIITILSLSVILLLGQFKVLMIVPSERGLHFLELLSQRLVLGLDLEKVLNSIGLVHSALNVL